MLARVGGSVLLVLLVAGGVAVAATRGVADASGLGVCVNDTNGLVRVAATCREHETAMALGGSDLQVTRGAITLAASAEAVTGTLPTTGLRLTGTCVQAPPEVGDVVLARMRVTSTTGQAFDAYLQGGGLPPNLTLGVTEVLLTPAAGASLGLPETNLLQTVMVVTPAGTATLKIGGFASIQSDTCRFSWQAEEVPA